MKKYLFILFFLSSCVTVRVDMSDFDDRNKVVFYDVDLWVKIIINQPRIKQEYKNLELKTDAFNINLWQKNLKN